MEDVRVLRCYTAPGEAFSSEEEMKAHYRTELHRFNLKRKVAGLAPLTRAQYEERETRTAREAAAAAPEKLSTAERRELRDERREAKVATQSSNPNSKAAHYRATAEMSEDAYFKHKVDTAPKFGEGSDLFSRHESDSLEENLAYMAREHGFFLPSLDYCVDIPGLLYYLQQKVYIGNVTLVTGRQFHSVEAVQAHMRAKCECRVSLEGCEDELGEFYDLQSLAAASPLWDLEEASEDEDEGEGAGERASEAMEVGTGEGAGEGAGEESALPADFDALFERAVSLGVITEAELDGLTDAIAAGSTIEAEATAEWLPAIASAQRKAARQPPAAPAGTSPSTSRTSYRIVYRPLQLAAPRVAAYAESLPTLALGSREMGHRSMAKIYKQKFSPTHGTALGAIGVGRPNLAALMHQYAEAGVLSAHLAFKLRLHANAKSERDMKAIHVASRLYLKQGLTNNTTINGMKHYKNQSLCF